MPRDPVQGQCQQLGQRGTPRSELADPYCCLTWKTEKQPNWGLQPDLLSTSCDQISSQQFKVLFGWSTTERSKKRSPGAPLLNDNAKKLQEAVLCGSIRLRQKRLRQQWISSCRKVEWSCSSRDEPFRLRRFVLVPRLATVWNAAHPQGQACCHSTGNSVCSTKRKIN